LIKIQTYAYPRLHSSIYIIILNLFVDLASAKNQKIFVHNLELLAQAFLEKTTFNEDVLVCMRSVARYKLMHIGFRIV
jgi:hypothetical protein